VAFSGGYTNNYGGGGGGGYFGGGGGGHDATNGPHQGGGGGGSGYVGGTGVTAATNTAGSGATPPNTADSAYAAGVAVGGAAGANGGPGRVVISWTNYTLRTPSAVNTTFTYNAGGGAQQSNLYDGSDATPAADPNGVSKSGQPLTSAAYDLGAAYDIQRVRLITAAANGFTNADVFAIEYSDTSLTTGWTGSGQTITANAGTAKLSTVDFASVGAHRYWRIIYSSGTVAGNGWLGELGFYSSP
jgi:hypothetical protein